MGTNSPKPFDPQKEYFSDYTNIADYISDSTENGMKFEKTENTISFSTEAIAYCINQGVDLYDATLYLKPLILKANGIDVSHLYAVSTSLAFNEDSICYMSYSIIDKPDRKVQQLPNGFQGEVEEDRFRNMGPEREGVFRRDTHKHEGEFVSGWTS